MRGLQALLPMALVLFVTGASVIAYRMLHRGAAVDVPVPARFDDRNAGRMPAEELSAEASLEIARERSADNVHSSAEQAAQNRSREARLVDGSIVLGLGTEAANSAGALRVSIRNAQEISEQTLQVTEGRFQLRARTGDRVGPLSVVLDDRALVAAEEPLIVREGRALVVRCEPARNVELIVLDQDSKEPRDQLTVLRSGDPDALAPSSSEFPQGSSVLVAQGRSPLVLDPQHHLPPRSAIERLFVRAPNTSWATIDVDWRAGGSRRIQIAEAAKLEVEVSGHIPEPQSEETASDTGAVLLVRIREQSGPWDHPLGHTHATDWEAAALAAQAPVEGEDDGPAAPIASASVVEEARALGLLGCVRWESVWHGGLSLFETLEPGRFLVTLERGSREAPSILGLTPVDLVSGAVQRATVTIENVLCAPSSADCTATVAANEAMETEAAELVALRLRFVDAATSQPLCLATPPRVVRTAAESTRAPECSELWFSETECAWTAEVLPGTWTLVLDDEDLEEWSGHYDDTLVIDARLQEFRYAFERVPVAAVALEVSGERVEWPEDSALSLRLRSSEGAELCPSRAVDGSARFKLPHVGPWTVVVPELTAYSPIELSAHSAQVHGIHEWIVQARAR